MAINKNHEFEELNGVKCAVVEKNVKPERVAFLKDLLECNGFTVVVAASPPPKTTPPPKTPAEGEPAAQEPAAPPPPETYTVGVTEVAFNAINAVYGRLLRIRDGRVVTSAYWQQLEAVSQDEIPYYERKI
ncbi:MAG TPA: hypothetical protein PKE63_09250 [Lacibacter sp.]|nr:hypothetical protein [Lacibacter sp.]HMO87842.1 hypothetical protein [Lacibacter sp.]HMP87450.1 hypothetical protein [Lacibacter sp.]